MQTAEELREAPRSTAKLSCDADLGVPGVYVLNGKVAWQHWLAGGHEGVMAHLVGGEGALPGWPSRSKRRTGLVQKVLDDDRPGHAEVPRGTSRWGAASGPVVRDDLSCQQRRSTSFS